MTNNEVWFLWILLGLMIGGTIFSIWTGQQFTAVIGGFLIGLVAYLLEKSGCNN